MGEWLDHHHHPGPAAKRAVIKLTMPSDPMFTKVVDKDLEYSVFDPATHDRGLEQPVKERGKHGDNVDLHEMIMPGRRQVLPLTPWPAVYSSPP